MSDQDTFKLPWGGGCHCGEIRLRVSAAPKFIFACHCTDCQQMAASAFSLGMLLPDDGFELIQGEPQVWEKTADSGNASRQFRCPTCSTWTHTRTDGAPGVVIARPMSLEDHAWVRPTVEIFTRSALPWAKLAVQFSFETEFEDTAPLEKSFAAGGVRP